MSEQSATPAWLTKQWKGWVTEAIRKSGLKNSKIAEAADCNASYISLMLRDGLIPRRDVVERLGAVIATPNQALLMAGYIPHRGFLEALIKSMRGKHGKA